jgi:ubiquinone/menaquinone biosynthesis C-methylase UbiE
MRYIGSQFHKPTGFIGKFVTFVMNRQNDKQYRGTEAALGLQDTDTVLDIGFGNGYLLHRLAKCHGCRFYGIDISEDMLRAASKRCRRFMSEGRMSLTLGDVLQTELPDNFFDKVYTVNTVYFWGDLAAGLAEIRRVLKSGGTFINAVYTREYLDTLPIANQGYSKHSIEHLLIAGELEGFTVTTQAIEEGKAYCLIYQKLG